MKSMIKLDIVSVEILTNIICVPLAYVFRKIPVLQQSLHKVYVLKDCKNSHENI